MINAIHWCMAASPRASGFLLITQLDDARVRHGSAVLRRPSSSIDRDFVVIRNRDVAIHWTSSSAVAKRPRDASCLSVDSFNNTIPRAQFFIISYFGFIFTSAYNSILYCFLRRDFESCCRTHDLRATVTVYSARPRLVGLALYTVTDDHDCL